MKERERDYKHKPIIDEEPYRNVSSEAKLKKIHARLIEQAQKQHRQVDARIKLKVPQPKEKRSQESTSKVTQFPPMIEMSIEQYASIHGKGPVERRVQYVKNTIDEYDMQEKE